MLPIIASMLRVEPGCHVTPRSWLVSHRLRMPTYVADTYKLRWSMIESDRTGAPSGTLREIPYEPRLPLLGYCCDGASFKRCVVWNVSYTEGVERCTMIVHWLWDI